MKKIKIPQGIIIRLFIPLLAIFMVFNVAKNLYNQSHQKKEAVDNGKINLPQPDIRKSISGLGVVEPKSDIIAVGTFESGIISDIYVEVGQKVNKDNWLFKIDDKKAKATLKLKESEMKAKKFEYEDNKRRYMAYQGITDHRAYSKDEFKIIENAMNISYEKFLVAESDYKLSKIMLERLLVRSPINGEVLRINVQVGEYANDKTDQELILIGDLSEKYVRVEIDESNAHLIDESLQTYGYLRGAANNKIKLNYVRIEPYVKAKVSIAGNNNEKIDTRVVEVIYSIDNNDDNEKILIGQNLDVFIEID